MGIDFGNKIATGDDGKFVINQMVANATQAIVLESLDQNTSYDFLGGETPAQRLADIKQQSGLPMGNCVKILRQQPPSQPKTK